jgi:primosomal protein N' (replication factor Y) (superfamily II helicase)
MEALAAAFRSAAPAVLKVMGPAPAPVLKIRNLYRYHLRLIAPGPKPLQELLHTTPQTVPVPHGVELAIDVDPVSML